VGQYQRPNGTPAHHLDLAFGSLRVSGLGNPMSTSPRISVSRRGSRHSAGQQLILIVGGVLLAALAVIYFSAVRRGPRT
jgi:hypothetical protein